MQLLWLVPVRIAALTTSDARTHTRTHTHTRTPHTHRWYRSMTFREGRRPDTCCCSIPSIDLFETGEEEKEEGLHVYPVVGGLYRVLQRCAEYSHTVSFLLLFPLRNQTAPSQCGHATHRSASSSPSSSSFSSAVTRVHRSATGGLAPHHRSRRFGSERLNYYIYY